MKLPTGEILRFGCIGVAATLTHFLILSLSVERLGLDPTIANGLAFSIALLVTFFGQSFWVFRGHDGLGPVVIGRFGVSLLLGLAANMAIMAICTRLLGLPYQAGFVTGLLVVPVLSYVLNKFWVFRRLKA